MKNKKKRIAIIGHFGGNEVCYDGQTVKTRTLYQGFQKELDCAPYKVDTYYKKHNPIKLLWQTFFGVFFHKDIFVLLSGNGMMTYFPFLYFISKIKKLNVYHDVIGGDLDILIKKRPELCKYLNSFTVNWVETNGIKQRIEALGINNASVLPNFKNLSAIDPQDIVAYESVDRCYCFCTFSRVMAEKGITDAIDAVADINGKRGYTVAKLDVYGPIEESYREEFDKLICQHSDCVTYKGSVDSQNSVQTLQSYFALLFPTRWGGEGFPGTILDCFASAVPVIATDWNANGEIINHMETGLLYPNDDFSDLTSAIEWAIDNKDRFDSMKKACRQEYEKYTPERIMSMINEMLMR